MRRQVIERRAQFDRIANICRSNMAWGDNQQETSLDQDGLQVLNHAYLYVYCSLFDELDCGPDINDVDAFLQKAAGVSAVTYRQLRDSDMDADDEGLFALTGSFLALYREYITPQLSG